MSHSRTIRWRLTLLYGAIFFASSMVVLLTTYALVDRTLAQTPQRIREELGVPIGRPGLGPPRDPAPNSRRALLAEIQDSIREDVLDQLVRRSFVVFGATTLLAFGAGWLVAGRALRPVHAITATARELSEKNLSSRVSLQGPDDELKEMADTFDALLDRLERAFESQRAFVASVSHELRTPLTIMRARAETDANPESDEVALRELIVAQVERADRLIDALLSLSRSQGSLIAHERVDLAEIVGDTLVEMSVRATAAGVHLDADIEDAFVDGDAPLLERLVGNLIENAIKYNRVDGHVRIVLRDGPVRLVIENDGDVIAIPQLSRLIEPFRRGGTQRTGDGYGLGLAVVDAVAAAHRAKLELAARPEGGLRAVVEFVR